MLDTNELMSLTILYLVRGQQDPIKAQNPSVARQRSNHSGVPNEGCKPPLHLFLTEINTRKRLGTCPFVQCKSLHIQNYSGI